MRQPYANLKGRRFTDEQTKVSKNEIGTFKII